MEEAPGGGQGAVFTTPAPAWSGAGPAAPASGPPPAVDGGAALNRVLTRRVHRRRVATLCSIFNPVVPSVLLGHESGHVSFHLAVV
jgi:hypothetical protein